MMVEGAIMQNGIILKSFYFVLFLGL